VFSLKRQTGNKAENLALQYLKENGLKLIQQNYLTKLGEIDIIMLDKCNQDLVFVEVRYRSNVSFGSAVDSVTSDKQIKIIHTAQLFLQQHRKYQDFICRFDVLGVESNLKYPNFFWIKDAFE
jgi:putative endonuclease